MTISSFRRLWLFREKCIKNLTSMSASLFSVGFFFGCMWVRRIILFLYLAKCQVDIVFGFHRTFITGHPKKVYRDLDHVKSCGFLHSVQHVLNNIFKAFLDIANFWPFLLYFMGILGNFFFEVVKCGMKLILSDRLGIWDVKNRTFSHCLCTISE